jgi:hypothetical protein
MRLTSLQALPIFIFIAITVAFIMLQKMKELADEF